MTTNPLILDMLGDTLKEAVTTAQTRLGDDTIMARCDEGLWLVERAGAVLEHGLTYDAAVAALGALT